MHPLREINIHLFILYFVVFYFVYLFVCLFVSSDKNEYEFILIVLIIFVELMYGILQWYLQITK